MINILKMSPPAWAENFKTSILNAIQNMIDSAVDKMKHDIEREFQKSFDHLEHTVSIVEAKVDKLSPITDEHHMRISILEKRHRDMLESS